MNFLLPMTPATTGPEFMPMRKASLRPPNCVRATVACMSSARSRRAVAWSDLLRGWHPRRDHVAIADRLDLFQIVSFNQVVEANKHLVEKIDYFVRRHAGRHRREFND